MNSFALLEKLCNAHGMSGYEDEVRELISSEIEEFADSIKTDRMGNLIAVKKGDEKKVMLASHMDEIGFMVKHVEEKGFLRVTPIGGWFSQTILNQRVFVHTKDGKVTGVFGCKPPHIMKDEERKKVVKVEDMFVDVGAESKDEVEEMGIEIGSPVTMDRELSRLGKNRITGKAIDDRAGVAAVIEVFRESECDATLYAVFTVQEEVGLKGARTSTFSINPDIAIAVDVCVATDFPGVSVNQEINLGKGPAITVADASGRGIIAHRNVLNLLRDTAEKNKIPYQLEVGEGGTTDATAIHLTREGIPSGVVSIPARYIHTPVEVIDLKDYSNTVKLLIKSLERCEKYMKF